MDLTAATIDTSSGVAQHNFGTPSSSSGWSPTGAVTAPGNPSTSEYNWTTGAATTVIIVTATDYAGNTGTGTTITLRGDGTGPVIDWSYPNEGATYTVGHNYLNGTESINWSASDTESGLAADGSTQVLQRQTGAIVDNGGGVSPGSCAGVSWTNDGPATTGNPAQDANGLSSGNCYRWILTATDNVGNASSSTSGSVLVDTSDPSGTLSAQGADGGTGTTRSQDVTVTCTCTDAESGIAQVRYAVDGGYNWNSTPWISWPSGAVHHVTLGSGSGTYTILAQIQDYAGNMITISTTITLQNGVDAPTLTSAALILDCDDPTDQSKWQLNTTGVIYWPVNRPLCLVPNVVQPEGGQGVDNRNPILPKYGNLTDWWTVSPPPPTTSPWLVSFVAQPDPDPSHTMTSVTWPAAADGSTVVDWDAGAPAPLRFIILKETAANTVSSPYIRVDYQVDATITWCTAQNGAGVCDAPEHVNPVLSLHIVAQNQGQAPRP